MLPPPPPVFGKPPTRTRLPPLPPIPPEFPLETDVPPTPPPLPPDPSVGPPVTPPPVLAEQAENHAKARGRRIERMVRNSIARMATSPEKSQGFRAVDKNLGRRTPAGKSSAPERGPSINGVRRSSMYGRKGPDRSESHAG